MVTFLLLLICSIVNGQIVEYYLPPGSDQSSAAAIYSFVPNPLDSTQILFDLRVQQNSWIGIGFAGSSGTTATNVYMNDTYTWIFANFDHGTQPPTVVTGTVKEFYLGYRDEGSSVFPQQITVKDPYSYDDGQLVYHSVQIIRPYAIPRQYTIPQAGNLCFIYAIGNEWGWKQNSITPVHDDWGFTCNDQGGVTPNPTLKPTYLPSDNPSNQPTPKPTKFPTIDGGTQPPSPSPSQTPSKAPSPSPSGSPTPGPTRNPTEVGETFSPTTSPTLRPSFEPTNKPTPPTQPQSTKNPTKNPTILGIVGDDDDDDTIDDGFDDGGLTDTQQILIIVGGFVLLLCCFGLVLLWYIRNRENKKRERLEKRKKQEELIKKQAEVYVADAPVAANVNATNKKDTRSGGASKKSKYDSDDDEFSGDADTDEELKKKYGTYMNDNDDDDDDDDSDSYLKKKSRDTKPRKINKIQTIEPDDDDDDDDSDSDIPARFKKGGKSKFARKNKYADDSDSY